MFHLDHTIAVWRRKMAAAGIKSSAVLDELESHLREDIEHRMRSGATEEQAFIDAAQRVGAGDKLNQEFGKISIPQPRLSGPAVRGYCIAGALFIFGIETWTLLIYDVAPAARVLGIAVISIIAAYVGALPNLNRRMRSDVRGWTLRNTVGTACSWAACIWVCLLFLSLVNINVLPDGIVLNVVCWGLVAAAAFTVIVFAYGTEPGTLDLWSPTAWRSFELAENEAARFHHDFIGTEHVLLGLIGEENSSVTRALEKMGVPRETVRAEIERVVGTGPQLHTNREPVCTPRAKKALHFAIQEAKIAGRNRVEPEDIFLGLLREGRGLAAKVLNGLGVNPAIAREEIRKTSSTPE